MKTLFISTTVCALCSLIALVRLGLMTVAPTPGNVHIISEIMFGLLLSTVLWSAVSLWLVFKLPFIKYLPPVPLWLSAPAILISVGYVAALWFGLFAAS